MAYTEEQLMTALREADKAGDVEAARRIAGMIQEKRKGGPRVAASQNPDQAAAATVPLSSDQGFGDFVLDKTKQAVRDNVVMPMARYPAGVSLIDDQGAVTSTPGQVAGVKNLYDKATGTENLAPADTTQQFVGAGISAATDPLSYAFPGGGIVRSVLGAFLGGAGGEAGGQAGAATGLPGGQMVGSILGGVTASTVPQAVVAGPTAQLAIEGARRAGPLAGRLMNPRGALREAEGEINREAESKLREVFAAAIKADPSIVGKIERARQDYKLLNPNQDASVPVPLSALLQNSVLDAEIRRLAQVDPVFKDIYTRQFTAARNSLERRQNNLFGDPAQAGEKLTQAQPARTGPAPAERAVERRKAALDREIARVGRDPNLSDDQISQRIITLTNQREEAAREAARPAYDNAILGATDRGVVFDPPVVQDLYRYVQQARGADIFYRLPGVSGRLSQVFGPREVVDEVTGKVTQVFPQATPQDIDSLKQAINLGLRKFKDPKDQAFLTGLREKLDDTIGRVDPQFRDELAAADDAFRESVGIPFNSTTLKKMDRAQYESTVGPIITKNPEALREFLTATGPEGVTLAESALAAEFLRKSVSEGTIDTAKARRWLDQNKRVVEALPGFRERYFGSNGVVPQLNQLENAKLRLDAALRDARGQKIIEAEGKTPSQLINELRNNPSQVERFLNTYGKDKDTLDAIRSFALDDVLSSGNPMGALTDKKNAALYTRLFGMTYAPRVAQLADLASRLERNPADVTVKVDKAVLDALEKVTGIPTPQLYSIARDRVASVHQKVFAIGTKILTGKSQAAADAKIAKALLDPRAVDVLYRQAKAAANGQSIDAGKTIADLAKAGIDLAGIIGQASARGGAAGAASAELEPKVQRQQQ